MAQNQKPGDNGDEYIELSEVEFVKRGRKPSLDHQLVAKLKNLPAGKALVLQSLKQNPAASTYANDKARVASAIRTACKAAGLTTFSIKWTPQGVPQVVR
jgi:hypothetical protein